MHILLIIILVLAIVGLALTIFKVPIDQRVVNIILFVIVILLVCSMLNFKL